MYFRREIVHHVDSFEQWHISPRVAEEYPFSQALFKQGGYGVHNTGFWVQRISQRDFSVIVITLSGHGLFTMEDGSTFIVGEGEIFVSSPSGQGHREETVGPEPWEHIWLTFSRTSPVLAREDFDWRIFRFSDIALYRELMISIIREDLHSGTDSSEAIELAERMLLLSLRRILRSTDTEEMAIIRSRMEQLWKEVSGSLDQEWSVERLCSEMNCSRSQLTRLCKSIYGLSPGSKIRAMKMEKAKLLLTNGTSSILEIAEAVGYTSPSLFSTSFTAFVGKSPREYRKERRKKTTGGTSSLQDLWPAGRRQQ